MSTIKPGEAEHEESKFPSTLKSEIAEKFGELNGIESVVLVSDDTTVMRESTTVVVLTARNGSDMSIRYIINIPTSIKW